VVFRPGCSWCVSLCLCVRERERERERERDTEIERRSVLPDRISLNPTRQFAKRIRPLSPDVSEDVSRSRHMDMRFSFISCPLLLPLRQSSNLATHPPLLNLHSTPPGTQSQDAETTPRQREIQKSTTPQPHTTLKD